MKSNIQVISLFILLLATSFLFCVNLYGVTTKTQQRANKAPNKVTYTTKVERKRPNTPTHDLVSPPAPKDYPATKVKIPRVKKVKTHKKSPNKPSKFITHVTLTTYHPVKAQCDDTPDVSANGEKIDFKALKKGRYNVIAVSRDLLPYMPYGSLVYIENHGTYRVTDTMNKRFKHSIDIMLHPTDKNTFKKENVKATLLT